MVAILEDRRDAMHAPCELFRAVRLDRGGQEALARFGFRRVPSPGGVVRFELTEREYAKVRRDACVSPNVTLQRTTLRGAIERRWSACPMHDGSRVRGPGCG